MRRMSPSEKTTTWAGLWSYDVIGVVHLVLGQARLIVYLFPNQVK